MGTSDSKDRREFLKTSTGLLTGVMISGTPVAMLLPGRAWALDLKALTSAEGQALLMMSRTIAPHDKLEDAAYAVVVGALDAAARDPAVLASTRAGVASLGAGFAQASEPARVEALRKIEQTSFFQGVRGTTLQTLYATPMAYALFGFEGEAFSKGGYLNRGFGSLRWLPEVPLEASGPTPGEALMATIDHNDSNAVVIIGSGAGGGTLAHELTRRGIKVVLLEAGARQSLATFSQVPGEAFGQLTWLDPRTQSGNWGPVKDFPTLPVWHCKTVGGTTVHWTGATPRLQPYEMRARSTYGAVPGTSLIDWPIEHQELLPWYEMAEKRMGVTRRNGVPGLPAGDNFRVMYAAARKHGYSQVHTGHMAINPLPADGRGMCIQQGFCVQGCKTGAKWSTLYTEIPRAEATGNLDLRVQSTATKIEHGADGRVNAVVYRDAKGDEQRQRARLVAVAGNSIETARLLLLSESGAFPRGLANKSDQVGRNYTHHVTGFIWAIFDQPVNFMRGAVLAGVIEDEAINKPDRGFFGGYRLEVAALDLPSLPAAGLPYGWGRDFASIIDNYRNMAGTFINGEDMPRADNRITLSRSARDAHGLPVAHVHCDVHPNDSAMRKHAQDQAAAMYEGIGAKRIVRGNTPPSTHNMCTARMSRDPADGVCNSWGQTHDIANLFISDGSALTSPGAANPTLTIVALALRQAEFIARGLQQRSL